jgi:hypothetical protein
MTCSTREGCLSSDERLSDAAALDGLVVTALA